MQKRFDKRMALFEGAVPPNDHFINKKEPNRLKAKDKLDGSLEIL